MEDFLKRKPEFGFTLIELMLILAIFGILIAIVAIFSKSAVMKSKNSNISSDVAEIRRVAQRVYLENPNGFVDLCFPGSDSLNIANPDLATLQKDIEDLGGSVRGCKSNQESYCVTVNLVGDEGFICIDDEGRFSLLLPEDPEPCKSADAVCP